MREKSSCATRCPNGACSARPKAILHSYRDVVWQYFEYFRDAAVARAAAGADRGEILRAVWGAFRALPLRTTYNLVGPRPLRKAFFATLWPGRPAATASF
jgi:hypothetical protein